jgi:hypothetical protein
MKAHKHVGIVAHKRPVCSNSKCKKLAVLYKHSVPFCVRHYKMK